MDHANVPPRPDRPEASHAPDIEVLAPRLLATVRSVAAELRPQAKIAASLGLDHSLERDYGLDSLARVELFARIVHELDVSVSEPALTEAETPRDLLRFMTQTGRRGGRLIRRNRRNRRTRQTRSDRP